MSKPEIIRFLALRSIGNFLLLFAIYGVLMTFGPALYFEIGFRIKEARGVVYTVASQKNYLSFEKPSSTTKTPVKTDGQFADILSGEKQQILIPKDTQFDILIPKIGANAKVFPNVDPSNQDEYLPVLSKGVAHAKGSVFPGMKGNIYLFAHSTDNFWDVGRYNAVFYLIKDLSKGDRIVMFFQGRRFDYIVTDSKVVDSNEVSYLVNSQKTTSEILILQTCWPPGTAWKRLLVFAAPLK
jgi:LPXTG-site transpeptidase (sortase) family protein